MLKKIEAYGIRGMLRMWLEAFLVGRKQRVVINGAKSEWSAVGSGIPQGSVLGPILFVIFINDLPDAIRSTSLIFAGDTKIYDDVSNPTGHEAVQQDLDFLTNWSAIWQIGFYLDKSNANPCT